MALPKDLGKVLVLDKREAQDKEESFKPLEMVSNPVAEGREDCTQTLRLKFVKYGWHLQSCWMPNSVRLLKNSSLYILFFVLKEKKKAAVVD